MMTFISGVICFAGCWAITEKILIPVAKGVIDGVKEGVEELKKEKKEEKESQEKAAAE